MKIHDSKPFFSPSFEEDRFLPEGPRYLKTRQALAWVNIQTAADANTGHLHLFDLKTQQHTRYSLQGRPGFFVPTSDPNQLLCGVTHSIGLLNLADGTFSPLAEIPNPNPRVIINDGEVTPDGRAVIFGTKDTQFKDPLGHLYLFTLSGSIRVLASGMTCSNGKILKGNQNRYTLFDIDTPRRNVVEYTLDLNSMHLNEERVILDLSSHVGFPDGMVDSGNGTAIIAFYNPEVGDGLASRYDFATGQIIEQWRVPQSPRVTCPALIPNQANQIDLYLTTATEGMPPTQRIQCPQAGTLFVAKTEIVPEEIPQGVFRV